ncbi:MAG: KH domain-containing protein, partial [Thermoplasmata archaeon]
GHRFKVEITSTGTMNLFIPSNEIPEIIGKGGTNIEKLEKLIGMHINVFPLRSEKIIPVIVQKKKDSFYLIIEGEAKEREGSILADNEILFTGVFSKEGIMKIKQNSTEGMELAKALMNAKKIYFKPW